MPLLVQQAYAAARRIGFALTAGESTGTGSACLPGTGRFLARVHLYEGWVISGCFGHAARPRPGMLAGS
jgi:hypothetical protein